MGGERRSYSPSDLLKTKLLAPTTLWIDLHFRRLQKSREKSDWAGCGWSRLLPPVPVTQCREQKDGRHAGQSASDKENAVGVSEAVRGAQVFDRSTGKSLQDLSQPGIG